MVIDFPSNPIHGQTYRFGVIKYTYVDTQDGKGYWTIVTAGEFDSASPAEIDAGEDTIKFLTPFGIENSKYTTKEEVRSTAVLAAGKVANIHYDVDIPFLPERMIKNLSGNLSFERASESTVINNSGIIETVAIDEPALSRDGIGIFEAVTNEFLWSEDFSKNNWFGSNTIQSVSGTETFSGKPVSVYTVNTAPDVIHSGPMQDVSFTAGVYICTYILKPKELGIVQFGSSTALSPNAGFQLCRVDFRDGTIISGVNYIVALQKLENGFWLFAHQFEVEVSTSDNLVHQIFNNNDEQKFTGNGTDGIYYYAAQLTKTSFLAPYIPTTDTPVTRAADECSIPMSGNMPPAGEPFTIIVDVAIPDYVDQDVYVFRANTGQVLTSVYFFRNQTQIIYFVINNGVSTVSCALSEVDANTHRFVCIFDGVNAYFLVDGITKSNVKTTTPAYEINGILLYLGKYSSNIGVLNSYIRNFKILDYSLSDTAVAALGGPDGELPDFDTILLPSPSSLNLEASFLNLTVTDTHTFTSQEEAIEFPNIASSQNIEIVDTIYGPNTGIHFLKNTINVKADITAFMQESGNQGDCLVSIRKSDLENKDVLTSFLEVNNFIFRSSSSNEGTIEFNPSLGVVPKGSLFVLSTLKEDTNSTIQFTSSTVLGRNIPAIHINVTGTVRGDSNE